MRVFVELTDPRSEEVGLDFDREWIEFTDPADPEHVIRADLTWLLARWRCLFAAGCHGIVAGRRDEGCCAHGAFFTDSDDEKRVRAAVRRLTRATWQHYRRGFENWTEMDTIDGENPARRTAVVGEGGPCVFHNDPGFPGGHGCALHHQAIRDGVHPITTTPDVLRPRPVRREQQWITRPDGTQVLLTVLGEFDRRGWGAGGHDLHWWCTSSPEAHTAAEPLYRTYREELTALIGERAYARLAELAAARERQGQLAPHPAGRAGSPGDGGDTGGGSGVRRRRAGRRRSQPARSG